MYLDYTVTMKQNPRPVLSAAPRYLPGSRKRSILLIHGWTGYPGQLYFLGEELQKAGYTVMIPRLPGHGTSAGDFLASTARDWIRRAEDAYMDLSIECGSPVVAGISMGALLALHLGAVFQPSGVIAAAPAMTFKNLGVCLSPLLKYLIKEIPVASESESDDPEENYIRKEYWSSRRLSAVAELLKVRRRVRKELFHVDAPLLLLEAGQDELVTPAAVSRTAGKVSSKDSITRLFPGSGHQMFNGQEKQAVAEEIIGWLEARFSGE
ncbi:alpha/beta fold hydrolase [Marispirochaeta aestuarii]|uniref:alpha/beta hydrolase n=1 Tax=Marispirochaeta aestuarii TaxID=1963862 RepID=UPI002ABDE6FC|nr:alpha/beta fold hydrolase [Marispirochaeta aestuarii]